MMYTIFGSQGFIGSELTRSLLEDKEEVFTPGRDFLPEPNKNLGHVIYCIGLTADFRTRFFDTIEAHVSYLNTLLKNSKYESFTYLSSTRVYKRIDSDIATEELEIPISSLDQDDLYNISKLMGESICMALKRPNVKVVRLSNVIGQDYSSENFFTSLIKDAISGKVVELKTGINSEKDYVLISDVIDVLKKVYKGREQIYNLGSGKNTSTRMILLEIQKHLKFNLIEKEEKDFRFPKISIEKLKQEFGYRPINILTQIERIIKHYKNENNY